MSIKKNSKQRLIRKFWNFVETFYLQQKKLQEFKKKIKMKLQKNIKYLKNKSTFTFKKIYNALCTNITLIKPKYTKRLCNICCLHFGALINKFERKENRHIYI